MWWRRRSWWWSTPTASASRSCTSCAAGYVPHCGLLLLVYHLPRAAISCSAASVQCVHAKPALCVMEVVSSQVGRGARASSCYLVTGERGALDRLAIMERSQDGFIIAQADLDHRCGLLQGMFLAD
jgi:hypothetical protein